MKKTKSTTQPAGAGQASRRLKTLWNTRPGWRATGSLAVLFALYFVVSLHKLDADFGWHLQTGNYIRAHGIPAHDVFSYTARQFPWIDHEWGNDVIASLVYGLGGYALLAALYAGLWSAAIFIAGTGARLGVLLIGAVATFAYAGVRPVTWTVLLLAITVRVLRSKNRKLTWLLPLLFIPWANLHAGFVIGLAIIVYYGLYEWRPALFGVAGLAALATLINIYGPRLYVEVARTLFDPSLHSEVGEWAPFVFPAGAVIFMVVWGAGGLLFERRAVKPWLRPSIPVLLGALSATRNMPLFIAVALHECGQYADELVRQLQAAHLQPAGRRVMLAAGGVLALVTLYAAWSFLWPLNADREADYPKLAVAYLQANGCEGGNVFNDYDYGGYLVWKLPTQPVFIDGRMPSWRKPDGQTYVSEYYFVLDHPARYPSVFGRYDIRCVLLQHEPRNDALITRLRHDHWRAAVNDNESTLLLAPEDK